MSYLFKVILYKDKQTHTDTHTQTDMSTLYLRLINRNYEKSTLKYLEDVVGTGCTMGRLCELHVHVSQQKKGFDPFCYN